MPRPLFPVFWVGKKRSERETRVSRFLQVQCVRLGMLLLALLCFEMLRKTSFLGGREGRGAL